VRFGRISCAGLAILSALPVAAQTRSEPVTEIENVRFYSDEWLNLHHTLYATAWAGRTQGRPLSQKLPHPLTAPFTSEERVVWDQAVHYYDTQVASRDLLNGTGMENIKSALVSGNLDNPAIDSQLRATLLAARPVFHRHFWPEQDRANRAWISSITERVKTIAPSVIPRLEKTYEGKWFSTPVRADAVWVGSWAGAYTTVNPPHATFSSTDPTDQDWSGAEIVFHEFSHVLVRTLWRKLGDALGEAAKQHGDLWHAIQFYLTGSVVRDVLADRKIDYNPTVYALGLFDRVWTNYRKPIEDAWGPYLQGRFTMDEAIAKTVNSLAAPK
jgi:hypothetical protein